MNEEKQKVKVTTTPVVPYLQTLIKALRVENSRSERERIYLNAVDALIEVTEMENELLTLKIEQK